MKETLVIAAVTYGSNDKPLFLAAVISSLFLTRNLEDPSANFHQTFPHVRK